MAKKVLVVMDLSDEKKKALEACAPENEYTYVKASEASPEQLLAANIILGSVPPESVKDSKNLEWLQLSSAGSDHFQAAGMAEGAVLTNSTGAYGLAISEHMIGMLTMLLKKLHLYRDNQRQGQWKKEGDIYPIYGTTTLIIGLGDIGGEFSRRMQAMGSHTIGVKRRPSKKPDYVDELYLTEDIDDLLPKADIIALCVPGTKETQKILSRERIAKLKENAVILNVGRGSAIDTDALCDAVESGKIYGAGLDVTDPEPLTEGHRMWSVQNIFITPHVSGGFHLYETYNRVVNIAMENYKAYVSGGQLKNVVDFKAGY